MPLLRCVIPASLTVAALLRAEAPAACARGEELFRKQLWPQAQERLWECVARQASSKQDAYRLTLTFRDRKNYEEGLRRLHELSGAALDRLYVEAFLLFRTGAHKQSIDVLGRAYRFDPLDWRIRQLFALNYVVMGIHEGAEQEFQVAVSLNPDNPELWYQLARFFYTQNRFPESLAASERALSLAPGYADAHNYAALCYEALAQPAHVREHYEKAIELNRKSARADEWPLVNYAAFLIKEERLEQSLEMVDRALEVNPQSARAYYLRGKALRKTERMEKARQALTRCLELDPTEVSAYYELAGVLRKMGDLEGSKRMFEKFDAVRKKSSPAIR